MKVLVLAPHPFYQNRGTPIAVRMLLETLAAAGHQLTLLTYPEGEDIELESCRIIRLQQISWVRGVKPGFSWKKLVYDAALFFSLAKLLKEQDFDLIHAVEESAFLAAFFGKKYRIPFVYDMDSSLSHQLGEKFRLLRPFLPIFRFLEKKVVVMAAGVIPVCKAIEELVKEYDPKVLCGRLEDVSLLPPESDEPIPEHARLDLEEGTVTLLYVGNLEKYQGIDLLLDAFVLAAQQVKVLRLRIIGGSDDDIESYRQKIEQLGIAGKVQFVGRRPVADLHHYLHQADILASPRSKGFNTPMKIYSYLDAGRVTLATRMQTHTQVLDDSIAYLVEATTTSMAAGLIKLADDETLRENLAAAAKERVHQEYTVEAFERKLNQFYKTLEQQIVRERVEI
jgi:glycosyltransferase involved in cell wall biosynthesis